MSFDPTPGMWVNVAGGLAVAAMGVALLAVRTARSERLAFGVFAVAFGLGFLGTNLGAGTRWELWANRWDGVCFAVASVALAVAALRYPRPLQRSERRFLVLPALAILAMVLVAFLNMPPGYYATWRAPGQLLLTSVQWGAAMLWALRAAMSTDAVEVRQYAILSTALVIYPASLITLLFAPFGGAPFGWLGVAYAIVLAACWLRVTAKGVVPGAARAAALWPLAVGLAMLMLTVAMDQFDPPGMGGSLRLFTVALLAYAVLRHRIFGIDVKVRFAISKSTIAAIFIAVFFIASEVAQQFFGERTGSTYFGIGIAGTLVFAMAPIQRAAERLAEKAVPVAPVPGVPSRKEQTYRDALAVAMRDRKLTAAEEVTLARLAEDLGIGAGRAMELRQEANGKAGH